MVAPDFKIFKIGMLATSAIIAPVATMLVQNEYAEISEEEEIKEVGLTALEIEELEKNAPTLKTLSKVQEDARAKRRARYRTLVECIEKIRKPTEECIAAVKEEMEAAPSKYDIIGEDEFEGETDEDNDVSKQAPSRSSSRYSGPTSVKLEDLIVFGPRGTFSYV